MPVIYTAHVREPTDSVPWVDAQCRRQPHTLLKPRLYPWLCTRLTSTKPRRKQRGRPDSPLSEKSLICSSRHQLSQTPESRISQEAAPDDNATKRWASSRLSNFESDFRRPTSTDYRPWPQRPRPVRASLARLPEGLRFAKPRVDPPRPDGIDRLKDRLT